VAVLSRPTHGLRDWLLQRISAIYLAGFLVFAILNISLRPAPTWQEWHAWFAHPAMAVASAAFVLAVLLHGWVGMRDVVLDYVRRLWLRLLLLSLIGLVLTGCGLWAMYILLPVTR
jgi:succinate dehydrogenase / fumarate reductase membrane anchor subunit